MCRRRSCLITVQYDDDTDRCMDIHAETLAQGRRSKLVGSTNVGQHRP